MDCRVGERVTPVLFVVGVVFWERSTKESLYCMLLFREFASAELECDSIVSLLLSKVLARN